jgi:hypothetical protein
MANVTSPPDDDTSFERLPKEPLRSYEFFRVYRDMPPSTRSMEAVRIHAGKSTGYLRQLQRWSGRYEWVKRARAWDSHIERLARVEVERRSVEWEVERSRSLMANLDLASRLRDRVEAMLAHPITREVVKHGPNGTVTYIIPCKWTFASLATMIKLTCELTAATISEGLIDSEDAAFDPSTATLEECREFLRRAKARRGTRGTAI